MIQRISKLTVFRELQSFFRIKGSINILAAMLVYGCGSGIMRPMNALYLEHHVHLSKLDISLLVSITLVVDMVVTFSIGLLSDKLRRKKTLPLVAAALCMVGLVLYMRADNFPTALFSMILATSPGGIIMGQLFAMARNHFTIEAKPIVEMAMVWLRALFSMGFFLGLLLGAQLFTWVSFQGVLIGNLVGYGLLFLLLIVYQERIGHYEPEKKSTVPFQWLAMIGLLLLLCGDSIRGLYFPLVVDSLFHSPALVSHLWSLQAIFELLWMTLAGYAATRFGALNVIRFGAICGLFVYLVYALHPTLPFLIAMQPIHSFFVSTLYSVAMGYVQRMFLHRTGFGSSLYMFLTQTASLIGFVTPNAISGLTPHIFFLPAGFAIASSLTLFWVARRDRRHSASITTGHSA